MNEPRIEQADISTENFYNDIEIGFCIIKVAFDEEKRQADYRFVEVNSAFEHHTGLLQATGQWMRNLAPDHEQFWFDRYADIARTGRPARFEYTAKALGGRHFEVYAYRTGDPENQQVAILFGDISARKQEEELRTALLDLADQLTEYDDVAHLTDVACRVLGQTLGVAHVGYGLVDPHAETITVDRDWSAGDAPPQARVLHFREFGSSIDDLKHGEMVVVTDAHTDPRTQTFAAALDERNARAFVNTPLFERGRFVALQYVSNAHARNWTNEELRFIREVGTRTRAATARRQAESALRASEAQHRQSLQQMPGFAAILSGPRHVFQYVNDAYIALCGPRDYIGNSAWNVFSELIDQGFLEPLDQVFRTGEACSVRAMPIELAGQDNQHFIDLVYQPIRGEDGSVTGVFVGGYDITEAHTSTGELREREQRLHLILAAATDYAILTLDLDRRVTAWSAGAAAIFGYSAEEIVGRSADILFTAEDRAADEPDKEIEGARIEGRAPDIRWHQRQDGNRVFLNGVMRPLRDAEGMIVGFLKIARDETSRLAQDEAVRELNQTLETRVEKRTQELFITEEALRQSQKMEAVGQLTGGLAHDFNNLLAVITGSLELLGTRIAKGRLNDIERFIDASQTAAKRASSLTHRLLAFSRRQTLDPQPTDVNALIADMGDIIRRSVGPEITVEIVGAPDLWMTLVDPSQLENALLNLCINARDAMPDGGRIMIEATNIVLNERSARSRDMAGGDYIALSVSDTGTGMPPEVVVRVFEPFYTTKPIGQGTGLGLSMVYGFARQSDGQVRIHSEVGKGTTINVYLPRSQGQVADVARPATELPVQAKAGQTVLVVDDEPSIRMLIVDVLEELGYVAVEAGDGVAGLKVLQSDLRVDLLVTDVGMPGMNGRQLADAGRVLRPGLRVLYITGYAEAAVMSHGHLEPGMAVITKPFALDAVANKIKTLIDGPMRDEHGEADATKTHRDADSKHDN